MDAITNNNKPIPSLLTKVLEHRVCRWTIGRIACAARIPLYSGAAIVRFMSGIAKISILNVLFPLYLHRKSRNYLLIEGAKDLIKSAILVDSAFASVIGVLFAPPKNQKGSTESIDWAVETNWKAEQNNACPNPAKLDYSQEKTTRLLHCLKAPIDYHIRTRDKFSESIIQK